MNGLFLDGLRQASDLGGWPDLIRELRQQVGYWKSRHGDALKRIAILEQENVHLRSENRRLQAQLFGQKSAKQSTKDRSNPLASMGY